MWRTIGVLLLHQASSSFANAAFPHDDHQDEGLSLDSTTTLLPFCPNNQLADFAICNLELDANGDSEYYYMKKQSEFLTQDPYCITADNAGNKFCSYTSATFANGRGISFFTTPTLAEHILNLPAFTNASLLSDWTERESNPPYEAKSIPGRGIGLIATRPLAKGDRVYTSLPYILVDRDYWILPEHLRLSLQTYGVDSLPEASRSHFYSLHGHFGGDRVDDIMNTNMFAVHLGPESASFVALQPETSVSDPLKRRDVADGNFSEPIMRAVQILSIIFRSRL
jgi:hypothetical protein